MDMVSVCVVAPVSAIYVCHVLKCLLCTASLPQCFNICNTSTLPHWICHGCRILSTSWNLTAHMIAFPCRCSRAGTGRVLGSTKTSSRRHKIATGSMGIHFTSQLARQWGWALPTHSWSKTYWLLIQTRMRSLATCKFLGFLGMGYLHPVGRFGRHKDSF